MDLKVKSLLLGFQWLIEKKHEKMEGKGRSHIYIVRLRKVIWRLAVTLLWLKFNSRNIFISGNKEFLFQAPFELLHERCKRFESKEIKIENYKDKSTNRES